MCIRDSTNTDPNKVDFGIPSNDDASKSIEIILQAVTESIKDGLATRDKEKAENEAKAEKGDDKPSDNNNEKK